MLTSSRFIQATSSILSERARTGAQDATNMGAGDATGDTMSWFGAGLADARAAHSQARSSPRDQSPLPGLRRACTKLGMRVASFRSALGVRAAATLAGCGTQTVSQAEPETLIADAQRTFGNLIRDPDQSGSRAISAARGACSEVSISTAR